MNRLIVRSVLMGAAFCWATISPLKAAEKSDSPKGEAPSAASPPTAKETTPPTGAATAKLSPEQVKRQQLTAKHGEKVAEAILAGKVLKNMTAEQVRLVRGEPASKEVVPPDAELWRYPEGEVAFSGGKVTYADLKERAPAPASSPPKQATDTGSNKRQPSPAVSAPEMVKISGGCFEMGSPVGETGRKEDERLHRVCVNDFKLGKYEVTVEEFRRFVESARYRTDAETNAGGKEGCVAYQQDAKPQRTYRTGVSWRNPNRYQAAGDRDPVSCVSWNDALAYVDWLSNRTGKRYRLPTEVEWEYAARGGTSSAHFWGDNPDSACRYENVADETPTPPNNGSWNKRHNCSDGRPFVAPVGSYQANPYGLYDMLGNVGEWTCSLYDKDYAGTESQYASKNDTSAHRSVRGGSWLNDPAWVRAAKRGDDAPGDRGDNVGFRLAQD